MNKVVNKFLLAGDKFMPEIHLKQPVFTYSACVPFTKNKERTEKVMRTGNTGNTDFIYKNDLDKACVQHDMAQGKSNKVLRDKAFEIENNPIHDEYQKELTSKT